MRRREFLAAAGGLAGALALGTEPTRATPEQAQEAIRTLGGGCTLRKGRVKLDLPPLVENGNAVPLTVAVESPMSPTDRVKSIHLFAEKNPQPLVAVLRFGPRAGRAVASTRIRLADSQTVVAVAEMSDGTFWSGSAEAVATMSACVEGV